MARKAVCKKCGDWWTSQIGKYPGEFIKVVTGLTVVEEFWCDSCGVTVFNAQPAACITLVTDEGKLNQHWEHEFIMYQN